jgi:hypothetical protein
VAPEPDVRIVADRTFTVPEVGSSLPATCRYRQSPDALYGQSGPLASG